MRTPSSSVYESASSSLLEPSAHAECVYRTVTVAAILLILASLWAF